MLNILVTNDDGIEARGIAALVTALAGIADVYVVAPKEQQSGKSMSITFMRTVNAENRDMAGAAEAFALEGTPADCIKWGLGRLEDEGITPDYVISGINMGYNLGAATHYSGTFAAAKEGALYGVRSIALSVGSHEATHFDYVAGLIPRLIEMSASLPASVILNVNAPDVPSWDIQGLRAVAAAPYGYAERYLFYRQDDGSFQMKPGPGRRDSYMRYDFDWVEKNYATVSPIPAESADAAALMKLNGLHMASDCLAVIVDAQEANLAKVRKPGRFERNIAKFAHAMSRMNKPVLLTETHGKGEIIPSVAACTGEAERVGHISPDAWTAPVLERLVYASGARRVLLAGALTNVELLQTAIGFRERSFETVILRDCCAAADKAGHKTGLRLLEKEGCRISSLETEAMELAGRCENPVLASVKKILYGEEAAFS